VAPSNPLHAEDWKPSHSKDCVSTRSRVAFAAHDA
jgi:hypothetical protein